MLKKYRTNILKEYRDLMMKFLIYAILIQVYSLFNIIGMINVQQSLSFLFPQLFQYSYYPTMYSYAFNLHRTMLINSNYLIHNRTSLNAAHDILMDFYNVDREINDVCFYNYYFTHSIFSFIS